MLETDTASKSKEDLSSQRVWVPEKTKELTRGIPALERMNRQIPV